MSQEKLSGLAILPSDKKLLNEFEYKDLINQIVYQKAIKIEFK